MASLLNHGQEEPVADDPGSSEGLISAITNDSSDDDSSSSPTVMLPASSRVSRSSAAEAMQRHISEIQSIHQASIEQGQGNVLVIVKFPANDGFSCDGARWTDYQERVPYERLFDAGSLKIRSLLQRRSQQRMRRRLGMTTLPDGIDYVLDLTPPAESDELAQLTCALWLPKATKNWWLAGHFEPDYCLSLGPDPEGFSRRPDTNKPVGAILALGHDDMCAFRYCLVEQAAWEVQGAHGIYNPGPQDEPIPAWRDIPDYCPIRHRVAIIRLIRAINGADLLINSATRMWTLANMAIQLDLTNVVRDQVAQWFLASPNSKFIELYPEESFALALGLRIPDVLVASFEIMVNEFAIDLVDDNSSTSSKRPSHTWSLRKRGDHGDYPFDPVDFAGRAFAERIKKLLDVLRSPGCYDAFSRSIPEWEGLKTIGKAIDSGSNVNPRLVDAYTELRQALTNTFTETVNEALSQSGPTGRLLELVESQRKHFRDNKATPSFSELYSSLNDNQKAMTPFFWQKLLTDVDNVVIEIRWNGRKTLRELANRLNAMIGVRASVGYDDIADMCKDKFGWPENERVVFSLDLVQTEIRLAVNQLVTSLLYRGNEAVQTCLSDHLIRNLKDDEMKYLPMWAGGVDDGSGGTFQERVPDTDMGPIEPGPAFHTGHTVASTDADTESVTFSESTAADIRNDLAQFDFDDAATVAGTLDVADGSWTSEPTPTRNRVAIAASATSEAFDAGADQAEFAEAMYIEPADHQAQAQAVMMHMGHDGDGDASMGIQDDDDGLYDSGSETVCLSELDPDTL